MNFRYEYVLILLVLHFIADFILQSDWMAKNKSKSWSPLLSHIGIYTFCFLPFGIKFALINGLLHLIIDYFTSRATSQLWARGETHWFFAVIGFDQLLHMISLISTLRFL